MKRITIVLIAAATLVAACSSPENSQEYRDLEQAVADLEARLTGLTTDVDTARSSFDETSSDLEALIEMRDTVAGMESDREDGTEQADGLRSDIDALEAESEALTAAVADLEEQVDTAMTGSSAFRRWVTDQNRLDERWDCAGSVAAYFVGWGAFRATPDLLMDEPPPESVLLNRGRTVLESQPGDGCDGWYPGATGGVWSVSTVFSEMCATVDVEALDLSPQEVAGNCLTGWGHVTFFDQDAEPCRLDADIGPTNVSLNAYELWVEFKDASQVDCDWLFALDRGDEFRWWAVADGITTATDEDGVTTMIPTFNILRFVYWYRV